MRVSLKESIFRQHQLLPLRTTKTLSIKSLDVNQFVILIKSQLHLNLFITGPISDAAVYVIETGAPSTQLPGDSGQDVYALEIDVPLLFSKQIMHQQWIGGVGYH